MQDFRNLLVWQKAHKVVLRTYAACAQLQRPGTYSLHNQVLRAAISVPANIAEGCGRAGDRDFRRFLRHSLGSACELEYYLLLLCDLGLAKGSIVKEIGRDTVEVKRMLGGLIRQMKVEGEFPAAKR